MSDATELKLWPSVTNAIDWSDDGVIALAADTNVELLFPNLDPLDPIYDQKQWINHPVNISLFTNRERPVKDPAPLEIFSIGEEISSGPVVKLAWSPPGLAKYRRPVLAVLGANLVLSIWASESNPKDATSWTRVLLFNPLLETYFREVVRDDESHVVNNPAEVHHLRERVRAFAWCPSPPSSWNTVGTRMVWPQSIIAVSNDNNEVVIFSVNSPFERFDSPDSWRAQPLARFMVTPDPSAVYSNPGTFDDIMGQQRYISHLEWGPRINRGGSCFEHILAYATNTDVRARPVIFELSDGSSHEVSNVYFGDESIYYKTDLRFSGTMRWCPERLESTLLLLIFTQTDIIGVYTGLDDVAIRTISTHRLDSPWDQISGVVFDVRSPDGPKVHLSYLLTTAKPVKLSFKLSPNGISAASDPSWQYRIQDSQAYFSVNNDLEGHALTKTWGIAASPLGDYLATCHTLHPSDMVEYNLAAYKRSSLAVTRFDGLGGDLKFPQQDLSAEAILFSVKKWFENNSETVSEASTSHTQILQTLTSTFGSVPTPQRGANRTNHYTSSYTTTTPPVSIISTFKHQIYFAKLTLRDRYTILVSLICAPSLPTDLEKSMIGFRLAREALKLPKSFSDSSSSWLSKRMNNAYNLVTDLIYTKGYNQNRTLALTEFGFVEECDVCGKGIPMESLEWGRCANGHKYARCGLSFLTIQGPNDSKYCGVCNKQYFNDRFVQNEEQRDDETDRDALGSPGVGEASEGDMEEGTKQEGNSGIAAREGSRELTLAKVVFTACDVCIYCGGRYTD
ncbi:hypothetical protein GQ43DRAFT_422304 [Delitschia confertaspora ATCC 74209]|uniref:Transcription factor IIIC putative zinc-finger domain-containing protein n=1 Tax=Delitschia confertaspora ATCC 74209 TaxID=1513339 RepID=A0A9P4MSX6_9PLEO|nr:hypothetical protein GQ43DRAFT_422304 [Delitschia confertaspora ATCC 74209]